MVLGHHRQRQVDPCSDPSRSDQAAVDHVDLVRLDLGLGKRLGQALHVVPVGSAAIAVEQPGTPEHERPGADRAEAPCPVNGGRQPTLDRRQRDVVGPRPTRYQQQVDAGWQLLQAQVGHHLQAARTADGPLAFGHGHQPIMLVFRQEPVGNGKGIHRPGHIQHQHIIEQHHGHGALGVVFLHTSFALNADRLWRHEAE